MSTAWFKPNFVPKLLRSFKKQSASVEIWQTTCIVSNFGKEKASNCSVLINSSSPSLLGVRKFSYFPNGGPQPEKPPSKVEHHLMGYVSKWGNMELKDGMLFPFNVVDGLVHQLGGWKLALHCYMIPTIKEDERCPVGQAVSTPPGGKELAAEYDTIVHTVPPFYAHTSGNPNDDLFRCYGSALTVCEEHLLTQAEGLPLRIACPLLGAGGRGFPLETAIEIAARASLKWRDSTESNGRQKVLVFGTPQMDVASKLIDAISRMDKE
jgi:O-acetyl-ADP-ribose deacetylase (regulator of RNase III)